MGGFTIPANDDRPVGMDIWHASPECPDCGHYFTDAYNGVKTATAVQAGLTGVAFGAPAAVTAAMTVYGWGYAATGTGLVALGSQADTELAALEDGVSRLDVCEEMYLRLLNMSQWWTFNKAFLDAHMFFGDRFIYVTNPGAVWSGSWYLTELSHLLH